MDKLLVFRVCGITGNLAEIHERFAGEMRVNRLGYNDVDGLSRGIDLS
jgi:hypothetical protein